MKHWRLAAGALGALGPGSESLARTKEEYWELLHRLITTPSALRKLRSRMAFGGRKGLESRPLFDTEGWFRDFEGEREGGREGGRDRGRGREREGVRGERMVTV